MKFLTIRQPWSSLIAVGAKTIETRSWSTTYRGPLAIHAGVRRPDFDTMKDLVADRGDVWERWYLSGRTLPGPRLVDDQVSLDGLPLGAIVAVADLVDVVPILRTTDPIGDHVHREVWVPTDEERASAGDVLVLAEWVGDGWDEPVEIEDQLPFGDFTPGRYAWLLDNVRPLATPIPMKGAQGLRDLPDDLERILTEEPTP